MNKAMRKALKEAFDAPNPLHRDSFFAETKIKQTLPMVSMTMTAFVLTQAAYVRKWIWLLDVCILGAALFCAMFIPHDMLWYISAMTPLLALMLITESGRSETYGMSEFEMAARFSLRSVVLARLEILGAANFVLLCLLLPLACAHTDIPMIRAGVYMLFPYMLAAYAGLLITRMVHGREAVYFCVGIAVFISFLSISVHETWSLSFLYEQECLGWWVAGGILLSAGIFREWHQKIWKTEEVLQKNLCRAGSN